MTAALFAQAAIGAPPQTRVTISPEVGRVRVLYEFTSPTTDLVLGLPEKAGPAANLAVEGEGLSLRGGRIEGTRPFSRVTLLVSPDSREVDSTYPLMLPLGGKVSVVYAPYLLPAAGGAQMSISGPGGKRKQVPAGGSAGYLVVGAKITEHDTFSAVVAPAVPAALEKSLLGRASALIVFYQSRLERKPERRPMIVLSSSQRPPGATSDSFRGDVTPNGVVFLRTYSDPAAAPDPESLTRQTSFLAHELFHLWNRSADPDATNWWLHEGSAEYASWLATSTLWPAESSLPKHVEGALRTCTMYLGENALGGLSGHGARGVRYPCGAVMQWIADAAARAHKPESDVFAIWRELQAVRGKKGSYGPADFQSALAAAAPKAVPLIAAILNEPGAGRWTSIASALNGLGAQIDVGKPAPFLLRLAAARPLVLSACGEVWGVGENGSELFVQAPESCSNFGDSPILTKVQGTSPMDAPLDFYEAVRSACEAGAPVEVDLKTAGGARSHTVTCTQQVAAPPPDLTVVRALPLP